MSQKKWSPTVAGRRNCSKCGAWRHVCFFYARKRNDDGTVKYVASDCESCRKRGNKEIWAGMSAAEKRRHTNRSLVWHRRDRRQRGVSEIGPRKVNVKRHDGAVDRMPFVRWLDEKIEKMGSIRVVAHALQLDERQLRKVYNGYETSGNGKGKSKLYPVDRVNLDFVDRALMGAGESWVLSEMYPL